MGTRSGGLVLGLLAAALVLMPAVAYGQGGNIGAEDPVLPLPLGHDRMESGGFFFAMEFVYWKQTVPLKDEQIAVRGVLDKDGSISTALGGNGIPGTFIGSRYPALRANDVAGPGTFQPGFRLTAGWLFEGGIELEANWTHLNTAKYTAEASVDPPLGRSGLNLSETFLTAFVFNEPPEFAGPAQKVALGNPGATFGIWDAASTMTLEFQQRFDQYELSARFPLLGDDCNRTYFLLGPRLTWIWERFRWTTTAIDVNTGTADATDVAIYSNVVSNRLYGAHVGAGYEWYKGETPIGAFAVGVEGQVALFADFVKEDAKYERADRAISSKRAKSDSTLVPELQGKVNCYWYPFQAVQLRVGYDVMGFFNTVSSPNPVSFNYGGLDPPFEKNTTRLFHGLEAGIGFIF